MATISFALAAGAQIGPLIAGYLIQAKGWRWFFIFCTIIIAFNLVTVILFLPETTFRRNMYHGETAAALDKEIGASEIEDSHHVEEGKQTITSTAKHDFGQ